MYKRQGLKVQAPLAVSAVIVKAPSPALVRVTSTDSSPQTLSLIHISEPTRPY